MDPRFIKEIAKCPSAALAQRYYLQDLYRHYYAIGAFMQGYTISPDGVKETCSVAEAFKARVLIREAMGDCFIKDFV